MSKPKLFSPYDIMNIWCLLAKFSYARVARRYKCGIATIRHVHEGVTYKRETRLVDPVLVARAEKAIKERCTRAPKSDVSYLDKVAF